MALNLPSDESVVINESRSDVQIALPGSNPFQKNSVLNTIITAWGARIFDNYRQLNIVIGEIFPTTASSDFLEEFWGPLKNITRNPATGAEGILVITGTAGNSVSIGETLQSTDGLSYDVTVAGTVADNTVNISGITRTGSTATAVTSTAHNMATGLSVTINGADQADYNGAIVVTVIDDTTFTYQVQDSPASPATGTIQADFTSGTVTVEAQTEGDNTNLDNGATLTFTSTITGIDSTATVGADGLSGGADIEIDTDLRERILRYLV
jgi:uncharacterized phage protein gp47/JayE